MADQLDFFVHGLRYGDGQEGAYVLPIMASCAQLRDLVVAAPGLTSRMTSFDKAAWEQLQATQGMVTLDAQELARFKKVFAEKCEQLTNYPQEGAIEGRQALEAGIKRIIADSKAALQARVEALYSQILHDMDHNHLPLPEMISMKAYKKSEQALLQKIYNSDKVKEGLPVWAGALVVAGTHTAALNYPKAKKNWLQKLSEWGWLLDAGAVAVGAAVLAGLGAMTPIGWAIAGAMLLTTFVDKWQGIDSKGTRLLEWFRRTWHGDYSNKNAVRQPNWKSWKPWVALGVTGLILFSAGAAAYKMFISAMNLTHAIFATIYTLAATSFTLSSLFGGFNKALKEVDMTLWFDKIREYNPSEIARVESQVAEVALEANNTPVFDDEVNQLAHENHILKQTVASWQALYAVTTANGSEISSERTETVSECAEVENVPFLPARDAASVREGSVNRSSEDDLLLDEARELLEVAPVRRTCCH